MNLKEFTIGNKTIGLDQPIFISAEVGTTCNGDVATAKKLIDAAVDAGMDAVKFQILNPDDKFSDKTTTYTYTRNNGEVATENIYEMLKQYVMTPDQWKEIKNYADQKGIIMFATPDYLQAVDLMEELNMPAYKIATWDATFYPLVRKAVKLQKPVIVDLGASDLEEVARILAVFEEERNNKVILLHCFHTPNYGEMNLRTVQFLRETFNCLTGFSAPDFNNDIDYTSLAFKPVYIEKRLTLDRNDPNHHHAQALEPAEMKKYVKRIRELSSAIGSYALLPTAADRQMRTIHFRSLVAGRAIKAGEELTLSNVVCRRPYSAGISTEYLPIVVGRRSKVDLKENDPISWANI